MVTCRDCMEGKHGACDGTAIILTPNDVEFVDCMCEDAWHIKNGESF